MNKDYVMPPVEVGEIVHWYQGDQKGGRPTAAIVTEVGINAICVLAISPHARLGEPKIHCRHVTDPRKRPDEVKLDGCWDYTPQGRMIRDLMPQPVEEPKEQKVKKTA